MVGGILMPLRDMHPWNAHPQPLPAHCWKSQPSHPSNQRMPLPWSPWQQGVSWCARGTCIHKFPTYQSPPAYCWTLQPSYPSSQRIPLHWLPWLGGVSWCVHGTCIRKTPMPQSLPDHFWESQPSTPSNQRMPLPWFALTRGGFSMHMRDLHPQNPCTPVSSSPPLRFTVNRLKQPLNALLLIILTMGGIKISWIEMHCINASSLIALISWRSSTIINSLCQRIALPQITLTNGWILTQITVIGTLSPFCPW